jgi:hypothetical protein
MACYANDNLVGEYKDIFYERGQQYRSQDKSIWNKFTTDFYKFDDAQVKSIFAEFGSTDLSRMYSFVENSHLTAKKAAEFKSNLLQIAAEKGYVKTLGIIINSSDHIIINEKVRRGFCDAILNLEYSIAHDTLQENAYDSEALMRDIGQQSSEFFKVTDTIYEMNFIVCSDKTIFEIKEELNDIYTWSSVGHFNYDQISDVDGHEDIEYFRTVLDEDFYSTDLYYKDHAIHLSINYSNGCPKLNSQTDATLINILNSYISRKGMDDFIYTNFNNDGLKCEKKIILRTSSVKVQKSYEQIFSEFKEFHEDKYKDYTKN